MLWARVKGAKNLAALRALMVSMRDSGELRALAAARLVEQPPPPGAELPAGLLELAAQHAAELRARARAQQLRRPMGSIQPEGETPPSKSEASSSALPNRRSCGVAAATDDAACGPKRAKWSHLAHSHSGGSSSSSARVASLPQPAAAWAPEPAGSWAQHWQPSRLAALQTDSVLLPSDTEAAAVLSGLAEEPLQPLPSLAPALGLGACTPLQQPRTALAAMRALHELLARLSSEEEDGPPAPQQQQQQAAPWAAPPQFDTPGQQMRPLAAWQAPTPALPLTSPALLLSLTMASLQRLSHHDLLRALQAAVATLSAAEAGLTPQLASWPLCGAFLMILERLPPAEQVNSEALGSAGL